MSVIKFQGAPYPVTKNPRGLFHTQNGINQIKSDLLVLLMTNPGERVMLPAFGVALKSLVFEQNDTIVIQKAKQMITNAIKLFEPRVTISSINVGIPTSTNSFNQDSTNIASGHILGISIQFFDPENISSVQTLTLELPLPG